MPTDRKIFIALLIFVPVATVLGVLVLTVMEYQARAALPAHEQTAEAIAAIYDEAVCLSCDFGRVFFVMFGSLAFALIAIGWGIYEIGSRILISRATPR